MNCPTIDELSMYADDLLTGKEAERVFIHAEGCPRCREVLEAFRSEQQFIQETLQDPRLPDDFTDQIMGQLEPVKRPKGKGPWKKMLLSAAGVVLAVGVSAALSPSFAQLIGGFFSSEQADEGLQLANEAGLTERVDLSVEDQGITLKVEDVAADSSRVTLSYQILKNGKPQNSFIEQDESPNQVLALDQNGNEIGRLGYSWWDGEEYGVYEFSLRGREEIEQLIIRFDVSELKGKEGSWQLDVPIDLREKRQLTEAVPLHDSSFEEHGMQVSLQKLEKAPSSMELYYETSFTAERQAEIEEVMENFSRRFGKGAIAPLQSIFSTEIAYHVLDETGKEQYSWNRQEDGGMLQGEGQDLDTLGAVKWVNSFVPRKEQSNLTFVLDGMYATEPSDFSITLKPEELARKPFSFEYEGNQLEVVRAKNETNYHLQKSWKPLAKESFFMVEMKGTRTKNASDLDYWLVEDGKGNVYASGPSGSVVNDEVDFQLSFPVLEEVPEELTLHLFSVRRYKELDQPWKVPMFQE